MQIFYSYHLLRNERRLNKSLNSYYDYTSKHVLRWMRRVMVMLTILAVGVPFLIFSSGIVLKVYSFTILLTIFYLISSFTFFCVSNDAHHVMEAEQTSDEEFNEAENRVTSMSDDDRAMIASKVEQWVTDEGYSQSGLTIQKVADTIHVPRYQLAMWLKTTEWELFNPWMTHLRIEKAKQIFREHPDWSNDTVAHQSGFTSRNYFQQVFKKATGMTPLQYIEIVSK